MNKEAIEFAKRMCEKQRENCTVAYFDKDHELHPNSIDIKETEGKAILNAELPKELKIYEKKKRN